MYTTCADVRLATSGYDPRGPRDKPTAVKQIKKPGEHAKGTFESLARSLMHVQAESRKHYEVRGARFVVSRLNFCHGGQETTVQSRALQLKRHKAQSEMVNSRDLRYIRHASHETKKRPGIVIVNVAYTKDSNGSNSRPSVQTTPARRSRGWACTS